MRARRQAARSFVPRPWVRVHTQRVRRRPTMRLPPFDLLRRTKRRWAGGPIVPFATFPLAVAVFISALAWAQTPGPHFRADGWQADEYGRPEGYPAAAGT